MTSDHQEKLPRVPAIIIATSLANGLEVYNIMVFGLFAKTIGEQFFPADDPLTSLLFAVATFSFGFLMRPLGALLIGAFADRVGRRAALTLTIWLTALGTGSIAFCPDFATIGLAAPIILIIGRSLEGMAAGGELGASATYAVEAAPFVHRGWISGWQLSGQAGAALLGAGIGAFISSPYSPVSLTPWGWRIPFIVALLIIPVGLIVQRTLPKNSMRKVASETGSSPIRILFSDHAKTVGLVALLMAGRSSLFYAMIYYMPSYLSQILGLPVITGFTASAFSAALLLLLSPITGRLADRIGNLQRLNIIATGIATIVVFPVFLLAMHPAGFPFLLIAIAITCIVLSVGAPACNLLILSAFPRHVRASGFGFSYGMGVTVFGGTAQFFMTALVKQTGSPLSPAWYLTGACLLSFFAALAVKPVYQREIRTRNGST